MTGSKSLGDTGFLQFLGSFQVIVANPVFDTTPWWSLSSIYPPASLLQGFFLAGSTKQKFNQQSEFPKEGAPVFFTRRGFVFFPLPRVETNINSKKSCNIFNSLLLNWYGLNIPPSATWNAY